MPILYEAICEGYPIAKTVRTERHGGFSRGTKQVLCKNFGFHKLFFGGFAWLSKIFQHSVWEKIQCENRDWFWMQML